MRIFHWARCFWDTMLETLSVEGIIDKDVRWTICIIDGIAFDLLKSFFSPSIWFCFFVELEIDFNSWSLDLLRFVQDILKTKRIPKWIFSTSAISSSIGRKLLSSCFHRPSETELQNTSYTSQSYLSHYICLSLRNGGRSIWLTQAPRTLLCREDPRRYNEPTLLLNSVVPFDEPISLRSMNCSNEDSISPPFCNSQLSSISNRPN